jgi:hypothetical protein
MMRFEGPAVQAESTWYRTAYRSVHGDRVGLDRSRRPGRGRAPGCLSPRAHRLRRVCGHGRSPEIELVAGDPDAMHDRQACAPPRPWRALCPGTGDGHTPGPQARHLRVRVISAEKKAGCVICLTLRGEFPAYDSGARSCETETPKWAYGSFKATRPSHQVKRSASITTSTDSLTGKPATQIPKSPVFALVSPGDGPTESNWVGVVGQGFQLYGGTSGQTLGAFTRSTLAAEMQSGSDAYGVYELWAQSFY